MDKTNFTITTLSEAPDAKFEVAGYIVYETAGQLEKALTDSLKNDPVSITVDMGKVVLFTSIGIRVILKIYRSAAEKGIAFQITNPSDVVRNVMRLSNLADLLLR